MADDLKKLLSKVQMLKGSKSYTFGYVAGKRKDGEGDGHLAVINSRKPFKKEDLADEVQSVQAYVTGRCWGSPDGDAIYFKGKGINERLVTLMIKTAKKQAAKSFDLRLPDEVEEQRQEKLEASSGPEAEESGEALQPPPGVAPATSPPPAEGGDVADDAQPPPGDAISDYGVLRGQVEAKLIALKAHAQSAAIPNEIKLLDKKMADAADKAGKGKHADANKLLKQVDTAIAAVTATADKAATVQQHYTDWADTPLNALKALPQKDQIAKEIKEIEAKLKDADAKIKAKKFDQAEVVIKQIFWDCDAAKKSITYQAARVAAQAKLDPLKTHEQKADIAGEIAALETKMKDAAGKAKEKKYDQAIALVNQVPILADRAKALADKLKNTSAKVATFTQTLKDGGMKEKDAAKAAKYAHKILAGENCTDDKAIKMAKTAMTLSKEGFSEDRAILGAKVNQALLDDGIDEEKAGVITRLTKSGGTATAEDAKVVAKGMKVFPTKILKTMKKNGSEMVACEGPITDYRVDLKGVQPRGWPEGDTWDKVPGVHMGSTKEVVVGTMDDGSGGRKVPGPGEGPVQHGAFDLIGHEGGHAFDTDGKPHKNTTPAFRTARKKDIDDGKMVAPRDAYFLQADPGGLQESFAECCARHFGNDAAMATDWPALKTFWNANPWA